MARGFTSLPALLLLTLLAVVSLATFCRIHAALILLRHDEVERRTGRENFEQLLKDFSRSFDSSSLNLVCLSDDTGRKNCASGKQTPVSAIDQRIFSGIDASFPLFDYNLLFALSGPCPVPATPFTPPAFRLTSAAARSASDCRLGDRFTFRRLVVGVNARFERASTEKIEDINLLAAAGFIEGNELRVQNDALIVAGGDIYISHLASEGVNAQVTLLSATGAVMVDRLDRGIALRAFGARDVLVPDDGASGENRLVPPMTAYEVLGKVIQDKS